MKLVCCFGPIMSARGSTQVGRAVVPGGTTWTERTKPAPTAGMEPSFCKSVILSPSVSPESVDQILDDRRCLIVVFIPQSVGQTEDGVRSDIPIGAVQVQAGSMTGIRWPLWVGK